MSALLEGASVRTEIKPVMFPDVAAALQAVDDLLSSVAQPCQVHLGFVPDGQGGWQVQGLVEQPRDALEAAVVEPVVRAVPDHPSSGK